MSATIDLMYATSAAQFAAAEGDGIPALEEVRPGLFAMGVPLPGVLPHFTLSYLIQDEHGAVHLIDPGWDSDENWRSLGTALATIGSSPGELASVTVTHLHPDHLGMAERARSASGAPVALHRREQSAIHEVRMEAPAEEALARFEGWGVPSARHPELLDAVQRRGGRPPFSADRLLDDGDLLEVPGRELRVLHTPGHTTGHLALQDAGNRLLFTGDLLLPNQFPGIGLGGTSASNPIDDYLASLERIAALDDHEVLPGHGYRFTGLAERCAETARHHNRRTAEVTAALDAAEDRTVWQVAARLSWTAGWENLHGFHLLSALSQTALHRAVALGAKTISGLQAPPAP